MTARKGDEEITVDADTGRRFVETMRGWLISLPHDLKILYEAAADENLEREVRELAVGAIVYVISPSDTIADRGDFSSYADDCILLRLALQRIIRDAGEDAEFLKSRFAEFFAALDDELNACKPALGDIFGWLDARVETLREQAYKGNKIARYIDDDDLAEKLYEDGLAFATVYPVDEKRLADKFKKASTILEVLEKRKSEEESKKR
jgi:uncharacterized membrane protein YkvA (DUF1232 family)